VASATAATAASSFGSATGNSTVGIFALGFGGYCSCCTPIYYSARNKYTYSGDTVAAGGSATAPSYGGSAAGNSTTGVFALGVTCSGYVTTRNKYTYSGCVVGAGGAATVASVYSSAAGNSTVGIFALGNNGSADIATRNKYTYSGCVVSAGGAATAASQAGSAASNGIAGITL
jgi:hypothetical protein